MGHTPGVVGGLALLAVLAGCSSAVPGQALPAGAAPVVRGAAPAAGTAIGDLCATLTPSQLTTLGLAGATGRSIGGPAPACHWDLPDTFVPVALMLSPAAAAREVASAVGAGSGSRVAGLPAFEREDAGFCTLVVDHAAGAVILTTPEGGCARVRRVLEAVVPSLPA
jgi:hypothetical protein